VEVVIGVREMAGVEAQKILEQFVCFLYAPAPFLSLQVRAGKLRWGFLFETGNVEHGYLAPSSNVCFYARA
jgi:hypothetical protein